MSEYVFKLPDLGEGTVDAEIVEWHVKVGDRVKEGDIIADVMTDKANVEVPAPVDGRVLRTSGQPGDLVAVGAELIALETDTTAAAAPASVPAPQKPVAVEKPDASESRAEPRAPETAEPAVTVPATAPLAAPTADAAGEERVKVITSPAIRRRAKEAGVDLQRVAGSGPRGRILRRDLEAALAGGGRPAVSTDARGDSAEQDEFDAVKVIGIRRVIADRMAQSKREIPHFSYVEEVDVTELERLRRHLNERFSRRLSVLPFIALGLVRVLEEFPQCNARFDNSAGVVQRYRAVHLGIATQTPDGLKVPVVRRAQHLDLWQLAAEIARLADAARGGKAKPAELSGSTITITSLGAMGGIVTTPVINHPEVGIVGVNKVLERAVVLGGEIRVRTMMNLSSSFDHRFVDGFDAAAMIQRLKALLEQPATLFLGAPPG